MKGDFTRDSFDKDNHFSQVLMQQGRVQLDADWNEQSAIMLYRFRSFVMDLVGPAWAVRDGFSVAVIDGGAHARNDLSIAAGRFYVDGIACDNRAQLLLSEQGDPPQDGDKWNPKFFYLVYLDAWEQLVTHVENDAIRELALGGPDTAVRAQVTWQVRMLQLNAPAVAGCGEARKQLDKALARTNLPLLSAWAKKDVPDGPCAVNPDSAYRGLENQLYRVEIHDPGNVADNAPSFKWSRENGSVIFALDGAVPAMENGSVTVTLAQRGRDDRLDLSVGDWVELVDDVTARRNGHDPLLKVSAIDLRTLEVTLTGIGSPPTPNPRYVFLRRWDQRRDIDASGVVAVEEARPLALEDGVTIQFQAGGDYRTGDYWLIPARTASGDVEWPDPATPNGAVPALPPRGVEHHYALLGVLSMPAQTSKKWTFLNCRCAVPDGFPACPL
jgi:hypothetical protein